MTCRYNVCVITETERVQNQGTVKAIILDSVGFHMYKSIVVHCIAWSCL